MHRRTAPFLVLAALTASTAVPAVASAGSAPRVVPPTPPTTLQVTTLASLPAAGGSDDGASTAPSVDNDGDVVFATTAPLVSTDANTKSDVYLRTSAGVTILLSHTAASAGANAASDQPVISHDGRYVAFRSAATNLDAGGPAPTASRNAVYLYDRKASGTLDSNPTITMVSVTSGASPDAANSAADQPAIDAASGVAYVAFRSTADNLISADNDGGADVFVHFGTTTKSISLNAVIGSSSGDPSLAVAGGNLFVAYDSTDSGQIAGDTNGHEDVFERTVPIEPGTVTTALISRTLGGGLANGDSSLPSVSGDGTRVAFQSDATNMTTRPNVGTTQVYVRDTTIPRTQLVSVGLEHGVDYGDTPFVSFGADGASTNPEITSNGTKVLFASSSTTLVADGVTGHKQVYAEHLGPELNQSMTTTGVLPFIQRVSQSSANVAGGGDSDQPSIANGGEWVAYSSTATNLAAGDTNGARDIYLGHRDATAPTSPTATPDAAHPLPSVTWSKSGKVSITLHATDPASDPTSGVVGFAASWNDDPTNGALYDITATGADATFTADVNDGKRYLHVRTGDWDGNFSPAITLGPFLIDANAPVINMNVKPTGVTLKPHSYTASWTASDPGTGSGLTGFYDVYLAQAKGTSGFRAFKLVSKHQKKASYTVKGEAGVIYRLEVKAADKAGNVGVREQYKHGENYSDGGFGAYTACKWNDQTAFGSVTPRAPQVVHRIVVSLASTRPATKVDDRGATYANTPEDRDVIYTAYLEIAHTPASAIYGPKIDFQYKKGNRWVSGEALTLDPSSGVVRLFKISFDLHGKHVPTRLVLTSPKQDHGHTTLKGLSVVALSTVASCVGSAGLGGL